MKMKLPIKCENKIIHWILETHEFFSDDFTSFFFSLLRLGYFIVRNFRSFASFLENREILFLRNLDGTVNREI